MLETGPQDEQISREQFKILLHYVNAHREDAHAKDISDGEFASLLVAMTMLNKVTSLYVD